MILQMLFELFFGIANLILELIPTITLPTNFTTMLENVSYIFSLANYFLPVSTILVCLAVIFLVDNIKLIMSVLNWLISKIPTIS